MNILLIEDEVYSIDSLKKEVRGKFPISSQIEVNRNNYYDSLKLIKTRPLLTDGWAIIISSSLSIKQSAEFCNDDKNVVIIHVRPKNKQDAIVTLSDRGIKFSLVDNVNVSKKRLVQYASDKLSLSEKDSLTLVNRCNCYLPYVNEAVYLLESLNKEITRGDVLKYVPKRTSFNVYNLFLHLIGYRRVSIDEVSRFIYDFRYAFTYLQKKLLSYLEDSIEIYILMENGYLGADNYKDFEFSENISSSEFMIKRLIIDIHPVVPLEVLLLLKVSIEKIGKTYELLNLI